MRAAVVLVLLAPGVAGVAHADDQDTGGGDRATTLSKADNRINLRLGGATSDTVGRPVICLDVAIVYGFGIEACGTGQGVIHHEDGSEMAHFRATYSFLDRTTSRGRGRLRGGIGIAELQLDDDDPGFNFGRDPTSVAGGEAAVQAQWLVGLGAGVDGIASLTAGVAVFSHASELVVPQDNVQPFASVELGVGW